MRNLIYSGKQFTKDHFSHFKYGGVMTPSNTAIRLLLIITTIMMMSISSTSQAQLKDKSLTNVNNEKQFFYADPLVFYNKETNHGRLDLYLEIPISNLQFKWEADKKLYRSSMSYDIVITDASNRVITRETQTNVITHSRKEQKEAKNTSEHIVKHYDLQPGTYSLAITLKDENTSAEHNKNIPIEIEDYSSGALNMSDVMLVSSYKDDDKGKKVLSPLINKNVGSLKDFYLFFEVYNNNEHLVKKDFNYIILDQQQKQVAAGKFDYLLQPGVNQKVEKINAKDFILGDYIIRISDPSSDEVMAEKEFDFKWSDMPVSIQDIDLAISQTVYIASPEEYEAMDKAKTNEDKQRQFIKFWKDRDPSPNTSKNELMIEYYNRIKKANERYSNHFAGWRSDMGMIYIIFGDPSAIEREPFSERTKPYEVWDYYEINRRFIFVDDTGFGDYRLTTPLNDQDRMRAY